jgi:hypothetical protein
VVRPSIVAIATGKFAQLLGSDRFQSSVVGIEGTTILIPGSA